MYITRTKIADYYSLKFLIEVESEEMRMESNKIIGMLVSKLFAETIGCSLDVHKI